MKCQSAIMHNAHFGDFPEIPSNLGAWEYKCSDFWQVFIRWTLNFHFSQGVKTKMISEH